MGPPFTVAGGRYGRFCGYGKKGISCYYAAHRVADEYCADRRVDRGGRCACSDLKIYSLILEPVISVLARQLIIHKWALPTIL